MQILITGGSGLIGSYLTALLTEAGHTVKHLSRTPGSKTYARTFKWDIKSGYVDEVAFYGTDAIVHLAGASVGDKRWTNNRKEVILNSRVQSAELLVNYLKNHRHEVKHFITASGINYYDTKDFKVEYDETSSSGDDFLARVCRAWEAASEPVEEMGIKRAILRTGVVFSKTGGALEKIKQPISLGLGAPLGSGKQILSWIHLDDLCRQYIYLLENRASGIYNGTSPNPVSNKALTRALAGKMKKPLFLPAVPGFALKLALGEMATIVLNGSKVLPGKFLASDFRYEFPNLDSALDNLIE